MESLRTRLVYRILPAWFVLLALACADDGSPGEDEVGDGGDDSSDDGGDDGEAEPPPIPVDPLEGGGGIPPTDDAKTHSGAWRAPATLGNGLVHDTRRTLDGTSHPHDFPNHDLANGVPWSSFVGSYSDRVRIGFRPAQLRARVAVAPAGNVASTLEIIDQSLYVADDDANYRSEVETYLFGNVQAERDFASFAPVQAGARPVSIDTFSVEGEGPFHVGYSVAWVYDQQDMPWLIVAGRSHGAMMAMLEQLAEAGYRPISIAARRRDGMSEYAAIFVNDGMPASDWSASLGVDVANLETEIQTKWQAGLHPIHGSGEQGSWSRFTLLWTRRPPGISVQVRMNLDLDNFAAQDAGWRASGYHLESVGRYEDEGADRLLAVWVRYEPYLRWQGTAFAPEDPDYGNRYRMFHDQAMRAMSHATELDCSGGQPCPWGTSCFECPDDDTPCFHEGVCVEAEFRKVLRPSATLHVFEGTELVLDRAYTFGPAIYEDTALDAPMKLASVSKSITAAAVVREMAAQGLPLTTPFNEAAGIVGAPPAMDAVTVLDVLRHLGGFVPSAASYADHSLIDASPFGTIPITGKEMFDYVVAGHLGVWGDDNYWDGPTFVGSQATLEIKYSNPGYSMLGELVRVLSGSPYPKYVHDGLLAPLGIEDNVFADPGHRVRARGVTVAGKRAYLVNGDHPYHSKPAQDVTETISWCEDTPKGWAWNGVACEPLFCECFGSDCNDLYADDDACTSEHASPRFGLQPLPQSSNGDGSTWRTNVGPLDPAAPDRASYGRYSGGYYLGGAPLAAGGWHGDGRSMGILIRALAQSNDPMWSALWDPQWWNRNKSPDPKWSYGLGWYVRGNWVAWAGGTEGSMATVLHNRAYDFTVVHLSNTTGNGLVEFADPLMNAPFEGWGSSMIGKVFPCVEDPENFLGECSSETTTPY
jgi:CubicO group peptidase (beta-lactamase class C family)